MSVRIVEVGPRDGLQNEKTILDTNSKMQFIEMLIEAGFSTIEATSFVRSEKIPQMSDAKELIEGLKAKSINFDMLPCLVPNLKGFEIANDLGIKEIAVFTATSEEFNKKNIMPRLMKVWSVLDLFALRPKNRKLKFEVISQLFLAVRMKGILV